MDKTLEEPATRDDISPPQPGRLGLGPTIWVAGWVSLLTDASSEMIVPILPLFLTTVLGVGAGSIGIIEGIAESTASVLKLFSGWLSDRLGRRKPLMVLGYGLSNLTKPVLAVSGTWGQVLAIRFADKVGKGLRGAPRDALIANATTQSQRGKAFGFHRAMDTLGAAVGPLLAFAVLSVHRQDYRLIFWISAIPGFLAVVILFVFLRERRPTVATQSAVAAPKFGVALLGWRFLAFCAIASLFALGNSSDAFLILRAQNVGMATNLIPLAYFLFNAVYSLAAMPAGILSDRVGRRVVMVIGYLIFAIIYLGFGFARNSGVIWGLFIAYGLYYALTEGIQKAHVSDLVPAHLRGMAIGTFSAMTGLAALPASVMAGVLWQWIGPQATFTVSSALAGAAAILLIIFRV